MLTAMEILALDVGAAKIGMARGSSAARLAEPLKTVKANEALAEVQKLIKQNKVEAIVVGLPRNLSGEDTEQTHWVRAWVKTAQKEISLPFYFQDEALTSIKANSYELRAKSSYDEHALAAAAILQDFLDSFDSERVLA